MPGEDLKRNGVNSTHRAGAIDGVPARFGDQQMEALMGLLLRFGVVMASTVVLAGGAFYLRDHAGQRADYRTFMAHPLRLRHPAELLHGLGRGEAGALIQLGVLLLVATPIARVVLAAVSFAVERDRLYLAISMAVLGVLLFGMLRSS
jgi:uncharacterized membrane protein